MFSQLLRTRSIRVDSLARQDIGVVQSKGMDLNEHLIFAGLRSGEETRYGRAFVVSRSRVDHGIHHLRLCLIGRHAFR